MGNTYDPPPTTPDSKTTSRENTWKKVVLQVITPLIEAVKEMQTLKENSRRELHWVSPWEPSHKTPNTEQDHYVILQNPPRILASHLRWSFIECPPLIVPTHTVSPPLAPCHHMEKHSHTGLMHFKLNRDNSRTVIQKKSFPNARMPSLRTLETGTWGHNI